MKINLTCEEKKPEAKKGDIIRFENGTIAIVMEYQTNVFLLKSREGSDWMKISDGDYQKLYKEGNYEILARASEWEINRGLK